MRGEKPLVSVVIPAYNRKDTLKRAIDSVLNQTYENLEIILVDDASTDGTYEYVEQLYGDRENLIYLLNDKNIGAGASRNCGVFYANGEYIAFHDSDDEWLPEKLQKQMGKVLQSEDSQAVYCPFERRCSDGTTKDCWPAADISLEYCEGAIYPVLLLTPMIGVITLVVKKDVFTELGGFNEELRALEDYEFSVRLAKNCRIAYVPEVLAVAHETMGSVGKRTDEKIAAQSYLIDSQYEGLVQHGLLERKLEAVYREAAVYRKQELYENCLAACGREEYRRFFEKKKGTMNVATALNKKYLLYTGVMLSSLCKNNPVHIDAYLLHSELEPQDLEYLQSGLSKYDITIHSLKIDREQFTKKMRTSEMWTIEAYYRLMLFDILPREIDRMFYFDVDLIINKPLTELYETDFEGNEIVACEDDCGNSRLANYGPVHQRMFGTEEFQDYAYFNSGVLLLNVAEMRKKYNYQYYMNVAERDWNFQMEAPDQDLLNYVHHRKVKYAPYVQYNLFARFAYYQDIHYDIVREKVSIIHFTGYKPWNGAEAHFDIEQLWWDYAQETVFYPEIAKRFILQAMTKNDFERRFKKVLTENAQLAETVNQLRQENERLRQQLDQ